MTLTRDESRELDRRAIEELGVPGVVLMENAGRGMAELLLALGVQGPVAVCCGRGNNGGDGFVIARHLDNAGARVRVLLFAHPDELAGDAAVNYRILAQSAADVKVFADLELDEANLRAELGVCAWVVDALFGVGLRGPIRAPLDRVVAAVNDAPARVLAVDVPSGLDCDTGRPLGPCVRADHTATVAALKRGFLAPEAREWLGQVHVIDMGAPRRALGIGTTAQDWRAQA
jgi:NAD(P)H-hydrate epimerase